MKKKIVCIINQISGVGRNDKRVCMLQKELACTPHEIFVTQYKGHAEEIAKTLQAEQTECIVAFGGDGTLHEIINGMDLSIPLGIVPMGSGNGVARHLKIPLRPAIALKRALKKSRIISIDLIKLNKRLCISNFGVGLDACIISSYAHGKTRGFLGYLIATFNSLFKLQYPKVEIHCNDKILMGRFLIINFANSNQIGYNFSFSPNAALDDGKFDVLIISPPKHLLEWLQLIFSFLCKRISSLPFVESFQSNLAKITFEHAFHTIQIDGEPFTIADKSLEVEILPQKLKIIV